jgi:hypothetical protein
MFAPPMNESIDLALVNVKVEAVETEEDATNNQPNILKEEWFQEMCVYIEK